MSLRELEKCVVDMGDFEDNLPVGGPLTRPGSSVPSLVASSSTSSSGSEDRYGEKGLRPIWKGIVWTDEEDATSDEESHDSYGSSEYSGEEHIYEPLDLPIAVEGDDIITIIEGEPTCDNDGHEWSKTFCIRCGMEYGRIVTPKPRIAKTIKIQSNLLTVANVTTLIMASFLTD